MSQEPIIKKEETPEEMAAEIKRLEALNALENIENTKIDKITKEEIRSGQIIVTTSHMDQFKPRWLKHIARRKDKAIIKAADLRLHFKRQSEIKDKLGLKAYQDQMRRVERKMIINRIFIAVMSYIAPTTVPELIKNLFF